MKLSNSRHKEKFAICKLKDIKMLFHVGLGGFFFEE